MSVHSVCQILSPLKEQKTLPPEMFSSLKISPALPGPRWGAQRSQTTPTRPRSGEGKGEEGKNPLTKSLAIRPCCNIGLHVCRNLAMHFWVGPTLIYSGSWQEFNNSLYFESVNCKSKQSEICMSRKSRAQRRRRLLAVTRNGQCLRKLRLVVN